MIITQTPLRISFVGGGTDFADFYSREDGSVISTAIDKYVYVIVKERFDHKIYLKWSLNEIVDRIDDVKHELVREAMRKVGVLSGVEITTLADIPSEGSGLGSSSSLTVGMLNALYAYQGDFRPAEQLAEEATRIEVDILGKPIGKQDQYIAAHGDLRRFLFQKDGSVEIEKIAISDRQRRKLSNNLMLFYTDRVRRSEDVLRKQKASILDRMATLRKMKTQVSEARRHLEGGSVDEMGPLLDRAWALKKSLASGISDREIDRIYQDAREAGASGGKISGAGGGGFLLLYCLPDAQDAVRTALDGYREMPFSLERDGSKVIFNVRREGWLKD